MNDWPGLDDFLRTDPRDVGCAQATEMLHVYAELVAAGEPAEERYPGIAAHLRGQRPGMRHHSSKPHAGDRIYHRVRSSAKG